MSGARFSDSYDPETGTLALAGEVEPADTDALREAILTHLDRFGSDLVVDLSDVTYLPSYAVGELARLVIDGYRIELVARDATIAARILIISGIPHRLT